MRQPSICVFLKGFSPLQVLFAEFVAVDVACVCSPDAGTAPELAGVLSVVVEVQPIVSNRRLRTKNKCFMCALRHQKMLRVQCIRSILLGQAID